MYTICIFMLPFVGVDDIRENLPHVYEYPSCFPDRKVHGANMGPIWDRQDPGGPHVGPVNFAIWVILYWVETGFVHSKMRCFEPLLLVSINPMPLKSNPVRSGEHDNWPQVPILIRLVWHHHFCNLGRWMTLIILFFNYVCVQSCHSKISWIYEMCNVDGKSYINDSSMFISVHEKK